jgi:hypothetical protein
MGSAVRWVMGCSNVVVGRFVVFVWMFVRREDADAGVKSEGHAGRAVQVGWALPAFGRNDNTKRFLTHQSFNVRIVQATSLFRSLRRCL